MADLGFRLQGFPYGTGWSPMSISQAFGADENEINATYSPPTCSFPSFAYQLSSSRNVRSGVEKTSRLLSKMKREVEMSWLVDDGNASFMKGRWFSAASDAM